MFFFLHSFLWPGLRSFIFSDYVFVFFIWVALIVVIVLCFGWYLWDGLIKIVILFVPIEGKNMETNVINKVIIITI